MCYTRYMSLLIPLSMKCSLIHEYDFLVLLTKISGLARRKFPEVVHGLEKCHITKPMLSNCIYEVVAMPPDFRRMKLSLSRVLPQQARRRGGVRRTRIAVFIWRLEFNRESIHFVIQIKSSR